MAQQPKFQIMRNIHIQNKHVGTNQAHDLSMHKHGTSCIGGLVSRLELCHEDVFKSS
jgi:hypothetical protein